MPETEAVVVLTTRRFFGDRDLLHQLADFELQIDHRFLADFEIDAGADRGLEALLFRLHLLRAEGQRERTEIARIVGSDGAGGSGFQALHRDRGAADAAPEASSTFPEIEAATCGHAGVIPKNAETTKLRNRIRRRTLPPITMHFSQASHFALA